MSGQQQKKQPKSGSARRAEDEAPKQPPKQAPKPTKSRDELMDEARRATPIADPLSAANLRSIGLRLAVPVVIVWLIAFAISGWIPKAIAGVLTLGVVGLAAWALRYAKRTQGVAQLVQTAATPEARRDAIEKLEKEYKKDDAAAMLAKAQLEMQEDPRAAQRTLEQIPLDKVMPNVADEARAQRAMLHLTFGETDEARALADKIDLTRHKELKNRALLALIVAESLARTGAAKKATDLLDTFELDSAELAELRPQALRAQAFAYAWSNQTKQMRGALKALSLVNPQYLAGFITKKKHPQGVPSRGVHPLLEKEAFDLLMKSAPGKRQVQRQVIRR